MEPWKDAPWLTYDTTDPAALWYKIREPRNQHTQGVRAPNACGWRVERIVFHHLEVGGWVAFLTNAAVSVSLYLDCAPRYYPIATLTPLVQAYLSTAGQISICTCKRCNYQWTPRKGEIPKKCAKCFSTLWNRDRTAGRKRQLVQNNRPKHDREKAALDLERCRRLYDPLG